MKPLKYTVAALALIAAATFTQSAQAANGDIVFGVYDSNNQSAGSYELDLGAFSTLQDGETFNLGTTVASAFASDSSAALVFNIAGASSTSAATGGFSKGEIAYSAVTTPSGLPGSLTTENLDITGMYGSFTGGTSVTLPSNSSSTSTPITAVFSTSSTTSFGFEIAKNGGNFGLGSSNETLLDTFPDNGDVIPFYTQLNNSGTAVQDGEFVLSNVGGNEILTFDAVATPEPSAYALGLCAVALFFVLKRRRSVA